MFKQIISALTTLWGKTQASLSALYQLIFSNQESPNPVTARNTEIFTDKEKFDFIVYLFSNQKDLQGLGLRHIDSNPIKDSNVKKGFHGDAISLSITPLIISSAFGAEVEDFSWQIKEDKVFLLTNQRFKTLDISLAIQIFDNLYQKILPFIESNFNGQPHHYMIVKKMNGATFPYDIKELYPTGKCGKQLVHPNQIVKVFSKNQETTPQQMLNAIIKGLLLVAKPHHLYTQESTSTIMSVLREIKLTADDNQLTESEVRKRLVQSETNFGWSDDQYRFMSTKMREFVPLIEQVNTDLDYFRNQI